jgi:hypothetical protein
MNSSHLTREWLTMFLLREVDLTAADAAHLGGCAHCLKLLSDAALDIARAGQPDSPGGN